MILENRTAMLISQLEYKELYKKRMQELLEDFLQELGGREVANDMIVITISGMVEDGG